MVVNIIVVLLQQRIDAVCVPYLETLIMLHVAVLNDLDADVGVVVDATVKLCDEGVPNFDDTVALKTDGNVVGDAMLDVIVLADRTDEDGCGAADDSHVPEADARDCDGDVDSTLGLSTLANDFVPEDDVERSCDGTFDILVVVIDVRAAYFEF